MNSFFNKLLPTQINLQLSLKYKQPTTISRNITINPQEIQTAYYVVNSANWRGLKYKIISCAIQITELLLFLYVMLLCMCFFLMFTLYTAIISDMQTTRQGFDKFVT